LRAFEWIQGQPLAAEAPRWALVYATEGAPFEQAVRTLSARYRGIQVFGTTSFQGVFCRKGFPRGVHVLVSEAKDEIDAASVLRATQPSRARTDARAAALALVKSLGRAPAAILLHATPGFEERILEGIDDAFEGSPPPVYGGSAADDTIGGKWRVFGTTGVEAQGFVLAGFASPRPIHGSFVAGYSPSATRGKVTEAQGRLVRTIDGQPAARVYNAWTDGSVEAQLGGGIVLAATTLRPLGRLIDRIGSVPRYLLSHPHEIHADGSMSLFTEVSVGDELVLMVGSVDSLLDRTNHVADRARGAGRGVLGAILVYCGGCVGAIGAHTADVSATFSRRIGDAPFLGAATFGEQGCFPGPRSVNRHGNLMCDALFFQ